MEADARIRFCAQHQRGETYSSSRVADHTEDYGHARIATTFLHQETLTRNLPAEIPTLFLPSPHHLHPHFQPFTSLASKFYSPPTPLNSFLLTLFSAAETKIVIQTPNLTSPPVLSALLKALERGVDVDVTTNEKLMRLEQLVTGGTTTQRCIKRLIRRYQCLLKGTRKSDRIDEEAEAGLAPKQPGKLTISYFAPLPSSPGRSKSVV